MRRLVFVLPTIVLSGCILGIGDLTGGEGTSSDGGSFEDAATADAVSFDASTKGDAPTVFPTDSGAEAGRFCPQTGAFLCDDFDDVDVDADVPGPWDYSYAPAGAFVTTTNLISKSSPMSAQIGTTTAITAILEKTIDTAHVDIAFDLFIQNNGSNSSIVGFTINGAALIVKPESTTQTTFLEEDTLSDGGISYLGTGTSTAVTPGRWVHVEVIVDFPSRLALLSLNGIDVLQRDLTSAAWLSATRTSVALGTANSNSTTFYYDNVVIRTD